MASEKGKEQPLKNLALPFPMVMPASAGEATESPSAPRAFWRHPVSGPGEEVC